ncbi:vacuolar protein-sorting-associated protein 25 [Nannizzia gypsea CBS 118893]|uniref:Vacuolar protein-sorting-associated protein 25 n=1 Tax=Arthroderma gypseum (strain ATCC MYA-4604 / CBS 118893) TaxID=535722 RepID=E4V6F5_ARTGP|nr:vacuolar protein-sorting-associated protein 25 [Nannizzia gypsea CBS 118893]EFQ96671.1 vacuolar protein-sorting-associated protein 25 [Nannizzia gypsea CBS 118893]
MANNRSLENARNMYDPTDFVFPRDYSFPPFYTIQPNLTTREKQFQKWSSFIQAYCRHHRIYRLSLIDTISAPLFYNAELKKGLGLADAVNIVDWMAGTSGGKRAEWIGGEKTIAWIWWKRPEEWASVLAGWVEETAQKNTVLTLYELMEGEATVSQEFHKMDPEVMQKALQVLAKQGKAQVFGSEDQQGVKFF